ncbi:MAG: hypothetical protein JNL87_08900 [Burkholderiaceae bacterium]|nr:hypothetical protein [Burkholderiaceae bacterium]
MPLQLLFWRDMLGVGTLVNLVATFAALMAAAQGAPVALAAALHFAPMPYNLFLFAALWRLRGRAPVLPMLALVWLVTMTVV